MAAAARVGEVTDSRRPVVARAVRAAVDRDNHDVLVVGSGAAGLRAALAARERGARVTVLCKGSPGKGSARS